ncbi:unnamed protein product [Cuscuta campestris]|uniref:Retrovirus-related Pol polyprotein from transposon TNT 1-94-like beta-barrel domain-containing protein n=1 Tax=Cuscuta campestris TaxID=132261 RepID=A0A484M4D6_9ASTE|nr:unnamed protein product [Cuscuta campestris]
MIRQFIDDSVFHHVANDTNTYEVWEKLKCMYERENALNKASIMRRLVKLDYRDGHSVVEHLNDFQGLINQLSSMKLVLDDELQALLLLSSLPESWETLVVSLSNSALEGKLTMDVVKSSLLNEEARRRDMSSSSYSDQAHVAEVEGRGRHRHRDFESRGRSKSRSEVKCFYCDKPGRKISQCRKMKRDKAQPKEEKGQTSEKKEEKGTAALADADDLFFVCDDTNFDVAFQDCTWIIDSGASCHLTPHWEFFSSYTSGDFGYVKMGKGDKSSKIVGMGTVCLKTNTGCRLILRDVRHVPEFRFNLISAGGLDGDGYVSRFGEGKWKLTKGSLVVARGKIENRIYVMQAKMCRGDQNTAPSADLSHKRIDHMIESCQSILPEGDIPFPTIQSDHGGEDRERCCGDDVDRDGDVLEPPHIEHGVLPQRVPQIGKFERVCYREEVMKVHPWFQAKRDGVISLLDGRGHSLVKLHGSKRAPKSNRVFKLKRRERCSQLTDLAQLVVKGLYDIYHH